MGTSCGYSLRVYAYRDHPHAYGDKFGKGSVKSTLLGSSPRVWGQAAALVKIGTENGIIPTRMGTRQTDHDDAVYY